MNKSVLSLESVTKEYKNKKILNNVSFCIEKGEICGLIGENGSGKTSIMKAIAGIMDYKGGINLFGEDRSENLNRVGFMIEHASLNESMTVVDNLKLHSIIKGLPGVDKNLLNLVGLKEQEKQKVKKLSMGMKQRLGIAISLIGSPELLILDEPMNALDPNGIMEIRKLILDMNENNNTTFLISSHNLIELSQVASDYIIMKDGEVKEKISSDELKNRCRKYISLITDNIEKTIGIIEEELGFFNYRLINNEEVRIYEELDNIEKISLSMQKNNIIIKQICIDGMNLENYYAEVVNND